MSKKLTLKRLRIKNWLIKMLLVLSLTTMSFGEVLTVPVKIGVEIVITTNFKITDKNGNDLSVINLNHGTIKRSSVSPIELESIASETSIEYQVRKYVNETEEGAILGSSSNSRVRVELSGNTSNMKLKTAGESLLEASLEDTLSLSYFLETSSTKIEIAGDVTGYYDIEIPLGTKYHRGKITSKISTENVLKTEIGTYETSTPVYLTVTYTAE